MEPSREPWQVFFETWNAETVHLPRATDAEGRARAAATLYHALLSARSRAWLFARRVLGWSEKEALLASGHMAASLLHWVRTDGVDRELLRARLRASQERGRAERTLGDFHAVARMEEVLAAQAERLLGSGATPAADPEPPA